jgi:hypothetical protein
MSTGLATHLSLRYLAAALVAGLALSLAPTAPAVADEPGVRQPRYRIVPPRVRPPVRQVRTVVRARSVPVPAYRTCGGCAPAPVVYRAAYTTCGGCASSYYAPQHHVRRSYYPRYYAAGCGGCLAPVALPYYWAVRTARYRYAYGYW